MSFAVALAGAACGCSLEAYRQDADQETYELIAEKASDPRWLLPHVGIVPPPQSRHFDPSPPDHPPLPPDDPAASRYMRHFHEVEEAAAENGNLDPASTSFENPTWRVFLALPESGELELSAERSVELALVHSRDYQFQLEDLYLTALALSLERFDFSVQWFGRNFTGFEHGGKDETDRSNLETTTNVGFSRAFSTGGQLLVDLANTFVWEFSGANTNSTASNIAINFVQPLLRGGGSRIRLEQLTQAERDVLYAVRDFARFRKQFYVDIFTGEGGFLFLLLELQGIRNLEANLASLGQNLAEHEALAEAGIVSRIQVDQVFQSQQRARLALIRAQNSLEDDLDRFKVRLGLPPTLTVALDDALLAPFQLNDPALSQLERDLEVLLASFRELDEAPSEVRLLEGFAELLALHGRLAALREQVASEHAVWRGQESPTESPDGSSEAAAAREGVLRTQVGERLEEAQRDVQALEGRIQAAAGAIAAAGRDASWQALQNLAREEQARVADLFILQTQVRVYLIQLPETGYALPEAVELAQSARLDLMNERARVVDAWRRVGVAADALQAGLDLVAGADIGTAPDASNPVEFSRAGSSYRVGVRLDGPLNRMAERNAYRTSLIDYQRARRAYMGLEDGIAREVRQAVRRLEADRLNFEITRQSLITAARQVEQAREQLVAPGPAGDSSSTQDVLDALQSLLETKNSLIGIWISYVTNRLQLLLELEALELDAKGFPVEGQGAPAAGGPEEER